MQSNINQYFQFNFQFTISEINLPNNFMITYIYIQNCQMIIQIFISIFLFILLWLLILKGFFIYLRAVMTFGYKKVGYIFIPFTRFRIYQENNTHKYGNSYQPFFQIVRKQPETKVILYHTLLLNLLFLVDPDLIKDSTVEVIEKLYKPRRFVFLEQSFDGIFSQEGAQWKRQRKILSNLFHFQSLKPREQTTTKAVSRHIKNLQANKQDCFEISRKIISESLIESLLGEKFLQFKIGDKTFYEQIAYILNQGLQLIRKAWNILRTTIFNITVQPTSILTTKSEEELYYRIIQFKNFTIKNLNLEKTKYINGQKVAPFLENYFKIDPQNKLFHEIFMQINNLFFAGVDSTTTALTFCLYQLAENQNYQTQLRNKIKEHSKSGQDIHSCKALDNFIHETLRLNPPVPILLVRIAKQRIKSPNSLNLFKNEWISAGLCMTMRNPKYFEDPQKFNPDRFNKSNDKIFSFIPFSAGPRNCIGQHMAMIMLRISIKEIILKYHLTRTSTEFKMFAGGFAFNRPLYNNLVKFERLIQS